MDDNYFELPDADNLTCRVAGYGPSFPILTLHVSGEDNHMLWLLTFVQPAYFRFPMMWKGCSFRLGTRKEKEALDLQTGGIVIHQEHVTQFKFFIAQVDVDLPASKTVEILALRCSVERAKSQ